MCFTGHLLAPEEPADLGVGEAVDPERDLHGLLLGTVHFLQLLGGEPGGTGWENWVFRGK